MTTSHETWCVIGHAGPNTSLINFHAAEIAHGMTPTAYIYVAHEDIHNISTYRLIVSGLTTSLILIVIPILPRLL